VNIISLVGIALGVPLSSFSGVEMFDRSGCRRSSSSSSSCSCSWAKRLSGVGTVPGKGIREFKRGVSEIKEDLEDESKKKPQ
jgi:hypothetical protein